MPASSPAQPFSLPADTMRPKIAPQSAPVSRCSATPTAAGPAEKVKASPFAAASIERIIVAGSMSAEAMWYSGVKKPVPWYVAAATIANIAMTIAATTPTSAPVRT
jgi:hypothetical protein